MNISDIEDKAKLIDSYDDDDIQNNGNTGYRFNSLKDNSIVLIEKKKCKNIFKNIPIYVTVLTLLLLITSVIIYFIFLSKYEITYIYEENAYEKPKYSKHKYSSITFENGLKVVLVQVDQDDKAGAAISFDYGYLDNRFEPGYLELAFHSLINKEVSDSKYLINYFGDFSLVVEKYYSSFCFQILEGGFKDYLKAFAELIYLKDNDERFNNINKNDYKSNDKSDKRKNHLLEYLIYGYRNSEWEDIIPESYEDIMEDLNGNYTQIKNIMRIILSDPTKIKIVIYSHYKMSLMKKYTLNYFKDLIKKPKNSNNINLKNVYNISEFNTENIIYFQLFNGENSFVEIDYFLNNENIAYNQLIKDSQYLLYITYILKQTNEGSLYYELNNAYDDISIRTLSCNYEVILKSRIKFSIKVELNLYSYNYITDIISRVYNYMNNIMLYINSLDNNNILNDIRIEELEIISNQTFTFAEDFHEKGSYKNLAVELFYKDEKNYLLKEIWFTKQNFIDNINKVKYYFNQFTLNNSVIILAISDYCLYKYNLFESNISYVFDYMEVTNYFNLIFSYNEIDNEHFDISYNNNYTMLLNPEKNEFISKYDYNSELEYNSEDYDNYFSNPFKEINDASDDYLKVFWKKDTSFHVPKVSIDIAYFHPFWRPNFKEELNTNDEANKNDILFFEYLLYSVYIERAINERLADFLRTDEENFFIDFNEDYNDIQLLIFSDKVEKVLNIIKDIFNNQTNFISSLEKKFEIYRDIIVEDYLRYGQYEYDDRVSFTFYDALTKDKNNILPPIYNIPNFPVNSFFNVDLEQLDINEIIVDTYNIKYIYLFGYYNETDAFEIYKLFKLNNSTKNFNLPFVLANYNNTGIDIRNFVDWNLEKPPITNTMNAIYNGEETFTTRFMNFEKYNSTISCLANMLVDILLGDEKFNKYVNFIIRYERTNIYLGYIFNNETMENNLFLKYIINCLRGNEEMNKAVDVIGDKFYYFLNGFKKYINTAHKNIGISGWANALDNLYKNIKDNDLLQFKMNNYEIFIQEIEKLIYQGIPYIEILPKE
mgnify:CR=1 FL=1